MRRLGLLLVLIAGPLSAATTDPKSLLIEQRLSGFTDGDYGSAVERSLEEFEKRTGRRLSPASAARCGLKVSSESGIGLSTPKPLVRAVSAALVRRGFKRSGLVICDAQELTLRQAGFLPTVADGAQDFEGSPVVAWEKLAPAWAAEDKLRYENQVLPRPGSAPVAWGDARVSILPKTLFDEVDFWINLPVLSDGKALGVHGAIASASLGNMANAERFSENPFNASKVAVEVCAIPGLAKGNALTILSLERFQVLGGPTYDAGWVLSEKTLLASANPVIIDFIGLQKINAGRRAGNVDPIHPEPPVFAAANSGEIRLGSCKPADITLVRLDAP
jgi:hypothetical protein